MRLEGKVGIVTGADRNIGEAIAHSFASEGARVGLVDVRAEAAERVADSVNGRNPKSAMPVAADVSVARDAERIVSEVVARLVDGGSMMAGFGPSRAGR